jgi:tetratricopeptide (TPR) repeat protein
MKTRHRWGALVLVAWLLQGGTAQAEETEPKKIATILYREGLAAQEAGDDALACEKYEAALAKWKSYKIAANLGAAELKLGRHAEAAEHLSLAVELMDAGVEEEQRRAVTGLRDEALAKVVRLEPAVELGGEPIAAQITIDGVSREPAPRYFVAPGEHRVTARVAGARAEEARVNGAPGTAVTVKLALGFEPGKTALPLPAEPEREAARPAWPLWLLGGASGAFAVAAGVGIGAAFHYQGERDRESAALAERGLDADLDCAAAPDLPPGCAEWRSAAATRTDLMGLGIGSAVAAGVLLGGAVAYGLWPTPDVSVGVAPAGLELRGRF